MSTTSSYLEYTDQDTGENNNTWGDVLDANFAIFEKAICLMESVTVTTADVTLTTAQNRNAGIKTTGTLTGNRNLIVKTQQKIFYIYNGCSGAFTLTVKTSAGTGIVVPQGTWVVLRCDGTNVEKMDFARKGDIKIWSGATTDIESGWQLCDGTNGTPNLRDKFVVGAGTTYAVGATGGATSVTSGTGGDHTHGGTTGSTAITTSNMPAHTHQIILDTKGVVSQSGSGEYVCDPASETETGTATFTSESAGSGTGHTHTISASGTHTHSVATLPPYHALCFIQKL